ncbi:MAG: cytochrome c biogenesis protein CcsA, partial [Gammaproteobacteria bacterium]|nr:cytochrome c biogenesis protein CcsA [Gammaproteobacteria bacterium]
ENASFMPWLVATALLHSLAVTEQRGAFRAWTALLALIGFALSLLGTFLVRSGVLVSVHAFATDPERGYFILAFLSLVVGCALLLFALRGHVLRDSASFEPYSRETLLLVNNVLLVVTSASVLLGTLFPIAADFLQIGKYSVGPPYFDRVFVALTSALLVLIGMAPVTRWKRDTLRRRARPYLLWLALSALLTALWLQGIRVPGGGVLDEPMLIAGIGFASWILIASLG